MVVVDAFSLRCPVVYIFRKKIMNEAGGGNSVKPLLRN